MVDLYNIEFEKAVLSTILFETIKDTEAKEINVLTYLEDADFYLPAFAEIFKIMQILYKRSVEIDENLIQLELEKIGKFEQYSESLLSVLVANPIANITTYAQEIKKRRNLREILKLIPLVQKGVEEFKDPAEILSEISIASEELQKNSYFSNTIISADELLKEYKENGPAKTVVTNFQPFDEVLPNGLESGSLVIIAGEPEVGKTHVSFAAAEHASIDKKVGIISLEFGQDDYTKRLIEMIKNKTIKKPENIFTNFDSFTISSLVETLYKFASIGVELVVIESLHVIENNRFKEKTDSIEDTAIQINHVIKKTGMVCFLIVYGSKSDYAAGKLGVKNSSSVPHLAKVFIRVTEGAKEGEANLHWLKNKQNKKYPNQALVFQEDGKIILKNSKINNKTIISLANNS